jgi:hypothetical protein
VKLPFAFSDSIVRAIALKASTISNRQAMNYHWEAALAAVLSDPTEQQHVIGVAGRSTVILQNPCPTAQYALEKKISFYKQPSFDSSGKLVDGAWKQVVDEEGCGVRRILNVLVFAQGPNNVSVVPLLPGTTRADVILQKDAVKFAVQAATTVSGGREANCQIGYVADSRGTSISAGPNTAIKIIPLERTSQ